LYFVDETATPAGERIVALVERQAGTALRATEESEKIRRDHTEG
jgi:hypothetical protein